MQSSGIIHRDLKPGNIFVDLNCDIKVGDLGMAKVIDYNPNAFVPMTEYVATRWYRAPEIMMWKAYGFEVDVWSVGCIMAELITRKPLFPGQDLQDQLRKIFSILGTPANDFISQIQNTRIVKWIQSQKYYPPQSLQKIIPNASNVAIDLLSKMLQYSPYKRISVSLALQHPYFKDFHDPKTEYVKQNRIKFPHEVEQYDISQLKDLLIEEVEYHANKNNYIPITKQETKEQIPSPSKLMPCIGSLNELKQQQPQPQQQQQQQQSNTINTFPMQQMAIMNGAPVVLTPVIVSPMIQSNYNQPFIVNNNNITTNNGVPWVIDKNNTNNNDDSKMEIDRH